MIIHLFCFIWKSFYDHTLVLFHLKILLWSYICFVSSENPSMIIHLFCFIWKSFYDHTFVLFHLKILLRSYICFVSSENPSMIKHLFCFIWKSFYDHAFVLPPQMTGAQYLVTPPNLVSGFSPFCLTYCSSSSIMCSTVTSKSMSHSLRKKGRSIIQLILIGPIVTDMLPSLSLWWHCIHYFVPSSDFTSKRFAWQW